MITFVVPTLPGRESLLSRCLWSIPGQVLVVDGYGMLGDKVNAAFAQVETEWVTVVDDDDYIMPHYEESVIPLLRQGVDYVGFRFLELNQGSYDNEVASQGDYPHWGRRTRGPVTKGVTRTAIARQAKFRNDYKADRRWSATVRELIDTSGFVDRVLYVHDWWPAQSAFGATGVARDVGEWPHGPVERLTIEREPDA